MASAAQHSTDLCGSARRSSSAACPTAPRPRLLGENQTTCTNQNWDRPYLMHRLPELDGKDVAHPCWTIERGLVAMDGATFHVLAKVLAEARDSIEHDGTLRDPPSAPGQVQASARQALVGSKRWSDRKEHESSMMMMLARTGQWVGPAAARSGNPRLRTAAAPAAPGAASP
eukprot:3497391-Rhodomonas_salina.4